MTMHKSITKGHNMSIGRFLGITALGASVFVACSGGESSHNGSAVGGTSSNGSGGSTLTEDTAGAGGAANTEGIGGSTLTGDTTGSGGATSAAGTTSAAGSTGDAKSVPLPALKVVGPTLQDGTGKTIVLRGSSLIDIGTLYFDGKGLSGITTCIDRVIAAGVAGHVVRLPVYPRIDYNGGWPYCSPVPYPGGTGPTASCTPNDSGMTEDDYVAQVLKPAVDYATSKNLYVIVDYHQIDNATSGTSAADANTFWKTVAPVFANYTNVLYEPFNEPMDTRATWATLKPVAQSWIDTIRAGAPNNIIIVSSPLWAQYPGDAASDPPDGGNLMYTAHVYPANWKSTFQKQVATAVTKAPVFITEWGYDLNDTTNKTTDTTDANWGADFRAIVDANGASWTAWVTDNSWQPRMFENGNLKTLTEFGTFTKNWLADKATSDWVW
jgi:hypothetical protein